MKSSSDTAKREREKERERERERERKTNVKKFNKTLCQTFVKFSFDRASENSFCEVRSMAFFITDEKIVFRKYIGESACVMYEYFFTY